VPHLYRAVALSAPIQQATRDQESGCHAYCFCTDPCDPLTIRDYELWEYSVSLVAHFAHQNYTDMLVAFSSVGFVKTNNRAYLSTRNEPVYRPNLKKGAYSSNKILDRVITKERSCGFVKA
jgi:quinol monooxygenase YgiN